MRGNYLDRREGRGWPFENKVEELERGVYYEKCFFFFFPSLWRCTLFVFFVGERELRLYISTTTKIYLFEKMEFLVPIFLLFSTEKRK